MRLVEETTVPAADLPIGPFRDHLRLGTGFADDAAQDTLLENLLRAAIAAIETRVGKAIYRRIFLWQVTAWRGLRAEELPLAPVSHLLDLTVIEADGTATPVEATRYLLERDPHRPALAARGFALPGIPVGGAAEVRFEAGYAPDWAGVPNDLKQAVFTLAAEYHEHRHGAGVEGIPPRVEQLLQPYRAIRLFGRRS